MLDEKSISIIDEYIGKKMQVVAYGAAYIGTIQKVDYENGFLIMTDGRDKVTLELERIESFSSIENSKD